MAKCRLAGGARPPEPQSFTVLRARIAAGERWAKEPDRTAATAAARSAFMDRFSKQVDPDGQLDPAERERRAESAKRAHFARMALKSAQARARRRGADAA